MSGSPAVFDAFASHPSLGEEPIPGRLVPESWRIRFESETALLEIPLARAQFFKSADDDQIEIQDPQQPELSFYCSEPKLLENRLLLSHPQVRRQIRAIQSQGEMKRRLKLTLWVLGGFAVAAAIISSLMGLMVSSLVARIPPEWERELGTNALQEIRHHVVLTSDAKLKARLDQAVNPLLTALPTNSGPFTFYIVASPIPNAFAIPGGMVFVNTGLLDMVERPEELAAVISHEVAHVTCKHGFRKIISTAGPYLIFKLFVREGGGLIGLLGSSSQVLVSQNFSQQYELEADAVGWDYMVQVRIDPRGMLDILRKFSSLEGGEFRIEALEDHPATQKRLRRLEKRWDNVKDKNNFIDLGSYTLAK